jgi:putative MATE family efflux protein
MNHEILYEKSSPIKLFFIVGIPSIISMLMSSFYVIADGVFVGQLMGGQALAAVNIVMPLVIIGFSLADLIGVGSAVPIAIHLGEKDGKTANQIFSLSCCLIVGTGIITGGLFLIFAEDIIRLIGADEELLNLSIQYLMPYAILSPFISIFFAVDNYLRICGKIKYSMWINITMAIEGVILEWLFLSVLGWGIWSASLAFCISMMISTAIAFYPFLRKKLLLRFVKPKGTLKVIGRIFACGSPALINSISGRVAALLINAMLLRKGGDMAVAAYSVVLYIDSIIHSLLYGLSDSLQPAISYNLGSNNRKRISDIMKICYIASFIISMATMLWIIFGGRQAILLFVKREDRELVELSIHALKLFSITFIVRWFASITQSYFTAVNRPGYAIVITTSMTFVFPVLLLMFLPNILGLDGIWVTTPIATIAATILAIYFLIRDKKNCKYKN